MLCVYLKRIKTLLITKQQFERQRKTDGQCCQKMKCRGHSGIRNKKERFDGRTFVGERPRASRAPCHLKSGSGLFQTSNLSSRRHQGTPKSLFTQHTTPIWPLRVRRSCNAVNSKSWEQQPIRTRMPRVCTARDIQTVDRAGKADNKSDWARRFRQHGNLVLYLPRNPNSMKIAERVNKGHGRK